MRSLTSAGDAVQVVEQTGIEVYLGHTRFTVPDIVEVDVGEMITELMPAVTHKARLDVLAETVHCYPTQAEVLQRVALQYANTRDALAAASARPRTASRSSLFSRLAIHV